MTPHDDTTDAVRWDRTSVDDPPGPDLDRYVRYEKGGDVVICDRFESQGWVKSDTTLEIRR